MNKKTIPCIICSKSRPAQLDLLLTSIEKNGNGLFGPLYVIMKASDESYLKGYEKVVSYHDNFEYINEDLFDGFHKSMLEALNRCEYPFDCAIYKFLSFFVDDNILYRPLTISYDDVDDLFEQGIDTLSLRLGRNTYLEDPYNNKQSVIPRQFFKYNGFFYWDSSILPEGGDFGYSMSLDGNIYKRDRITNTIIDTEFENPNFLEGRLNHKRREYPYMACQDQSCVVNSPNNRVQSIFNNRSGENFYLDPKMINEQFLDGYRFSLDKIDFSRIIGAHQELPLVMEKV